MAAVPTKKPRPLRGAVISNASLDIRRLAERKSVVHQLRIALARPDKLLNTEDDVMIRDGVVSQDIRSSAKTGQQHGRRAEHVKP